MKLSVNREFFGRHLFVVLLMAGLGCWFGYDAVVGYPQTDAAALYRSIEGSEAPAGFDLAAFKRQKTQSQYGFAILAFLASALVGGHLWLVTRLRFAFDETGFTIGERRYAFSDIRKTDWSKWEKKGIVGLSGEGFSLKLDAWHHVGVKDFAQRIKELGK